MNMVQPWSQYVLRASSTNHLALYECVEPTPCSSMHWPIGDSPPAYAITKGPDEKIGWHTLLLKGGPADAYNEIELGPESQRRLALSTHRGVVLPTQLPFSISSATRVLPRCYKPAHK